MWWMHQSANPGVYDCSRKKDPFFPLFCREAAKKKFWGFSPNECCERSQKGEPKKREKKKEKKM